MLTLPTLTLLVYLGALAATLVLAALLTPASWWKRPNLLAACVLAGGTWGLGGLGLQALAANSAQAAPVLPAAMKLAKVTAVPPVQRFVAHDDLNLRSGATTSARRLAVVPVGSIVSTTGLRDGDWWQVSATVGGEKLTGWTSSLWLRRSGESAQ
jgi:uncharacterized protein YgiM (DUF1202 family)